MFRKNDTHNDSLIHKKIMAIVVTLMMLGFLMPAHVFVLASSNSSDYLCGHVHDESCGNTEAGSSETCNHTCNILSFEDYTPGEALDTFTAKAGQTYEEICAELPEYLTGKLDCTDGEIEIPVKWTCKTFTGEAGKYSFHAKLTNKHCSYTVEDELPFITVTVPKVINDSGNNIKKISRVKKTISDDTNTVTVSGLMPDDARLKVKVLSEEEVKAYVPESEKDAFAYDIKIMTGGILDKDTGKYIGESEYQPEEGSPVDVTIKPSESIEASVEVLHIDKDTKTGEVTKSTIKDVTTILSDNTTSQPGEVKFQTNGFSVFVVKIYDDNSALHSINFPVGDYTVEYSTSANKGFTVLTSDILTLGSSTTGATNPTHLYFKVNANLGFTMGTVSVDSGTLVYTNSVYDLSVSGAASSINVTIPVTGIKITGNPNVGQTLSAELSDNLSGSSYVWKSCDTANGTFNVISGATQNTLLLDNAYMDKYIMVETSIGGNSYTSAPVGPVTTDNKITFDLAKGCVDIGIIDNDQTIYRGFNSAGALVFGIHADNNKYEVMQSNPGTAIDNRITLLGKSSKPKYDVTLNGIKCDTGINKNIGGIIANALSNTQMEITLRLQGNNSVGRVHYSTGAGGYSSSSSLKITSASGDGEIAGTLTAESMISWSAAIGGIDSSTEDAMNIIIAGGTINATGLYSSAIGGGGNGYSDVKITGGIVTATSGVPENNLEYNGTGATIGGGGGQTSPGGGGYVTISGGTVTATNNGKGVAIGSGGSVDSKGVASEVTITGGSVTTNGNIGGGNSENANGGKATVNISGGKVSVNSGSIGGGNGTNGGTATVNITGGTIVTPHISGGLSSSTGTHKDATVSIAAASVNIGDRANINSVTGPDPNNLGMPTVVYCQPIDVDSLDFIGGSGTITIQSASLSDGHDYELKDVYADDEGKVYFWLPTEYSVTSLTINNISYTVSDSGQTPVATITHDSSTVGSVLSAILKYSEPSDYQWQISDDGTDGSWTNISGATSSKYTVVSGNERKYIRVVITSIGGREIASGKLLITNTPYACIQYESLEVPNVLTAQLLNGIGGTYTYTWQESNDGTNWTNISDATAANFTTELSHVGKRIRVKITDSSNTYITSFVGIRAPQLDITAPLSMEISVNGAGECTVTSNSNQIINYSAVPVYVTDIAYDWITNGESDADEIFYHYENAEATLTLGETSNETSYSFRGSVPGSIQPNISIAAKSGVTSGTLPLQWAFNLGSGNYINLAPAVNGTKVATITYTVDYKLTP